MEKLIVTGIDGNLGKVAAQEIQKLVPADKLIFCSYDKEVLKDYEQLGIETQQTDFNHYDGLEKAFQHGTKLLLISMPFVGKKRQAAHKNVVDAAKKLGLNRSCTLHSSMQMILLTRVLKRKIISILKIILKIRD